jgi:hypothetical protein
MRTTQWEGTLTALSSIAHGGETRGTITLLRRELVCSSSGELVHVPIVSGNTLRGRLRRLGEELLRDAVGYEGLLHPAAAHALRGGGSLAKTGHEPLSGNRLQQLRDLVPQIGVFGAAGGGTIINGALDVGKVVPHLSETSHITGVTTTRSAFTGTQLEAYTRQDDSDGHDFAGVITPVDTGAELLFDDTGRPEPVLRGGNQMLFHIETFPAGTTFSTWLRLRRPSPLEMAFFLEVLDTFHSDGRLGGRVGIGHGQVRADLTVDVPPATEELPDWRAVLDQNRSEILTALQGLA